MRRVTGRHGFRLATVIAQTILEDPVSTVPPNDRDDHDATPDDHAADHVERAADHVEGTPVDDTPDDTDAGATPVGSPVDTDAGADASSTESTRAADSTSVDRPVDGGVLPSPTRPEDAVEDVRFGETGERDETPVRHDAGTATAIPTAEEDAAVREERARRFGRPGAADETRTEQASETTTNEDHDATRTVGLGAAGAGVAGAGAAGAGAAANDSTRTRPLGFSGTGTPPEASTRSAEEVAPRLDTTRSDSADPFEDWDDGPRSRAGAHWWGVLISLVFVPVSWYFIADGGERLSHSLGINPEAVNIAGIIELAGGLLALILVLLSARWSSVGAIIMGSIVTLFGAAFLVIPTMTLNFLTDQSETIDRLRQFGQNFADHLVSDGQSGRLLAYGIVLIFIGIVSHGARRQGRREERRKAAAATAS